VVQMRLMDFSDVSPPEQRVSLAELLVAALAYIAADLAVTVTVIGRQLFCHMAADHAGTWMAGK
jgi:hypothetical protein